MFFRILLFALIFILLYRFLSRLLGGGNKGRGRQQHARFNPRAGDNTNGQRKRNLDQIEDAEFEDITEKEKK